MQYSNPNGMQNTNEDAVRIGRILPVGARPQRTTITRVRTWDAHGGHEPHGQGKSLWVGDLGIDDVMCIALTTTELGSP